MIHRKTIFYFITLIFILQSIGINAQSHTGWQHLSPVPNSTSNSISSTIILREGSGIEPGKVNKDLISVVGSKSGKINGSLVLLKDGKTLVFKPFNKFKFDEYVDVKVSEGLSKANGGEINSLSFSFSTASDNIESLWQEIASNYNSPEVPDLDQPTSDLKPTIRTEVYNDSLIGNGKIFLAAYGVINQTFQSSDTIPSSVLIAENDGSLYFSKNIGSNKGAGLTDFKLHSNGLMSYPEVIRNYPWTGGAEVSHTILDQSFNEVDSYQMGNGYTAELHDFQMLPNGNVLMMAYYLVPIDLRGTVEGAHPNAFIDGAVVQEVDPDKNVVFQWRTWDYLNPNIIPWNMVPGNTQQIINVFHLNSIRLDNDGNLLLGTVGMGIKVNRQTGSLMWIIGGIMNQFSFTNVNPMEAVGDFGGHTFHRLPNGNILVYDNSPFPWQQGFGQISSEVVEYSIDETNLTATLVWKYQPDQVISGWHAGSVQRISNGNTVICWGGPPNQGANSIPIMTEVTASGEKVFDLFYEGTQFESYRAFRFELDEGLPSSEITVSEVAPGNTYDFTSTTQPDPGVSLRINDVASVGYNEITVSKYNFAPSNPQFLGKSPHLIPQRIVLSQIGTTSIEAEVRLDIQKWNIIDPENTLIYYREFEGNGVFLPLSTTNNFVTGNLQATISGYGELVVGVPDSESQLVPPIPNSPFNESSHNYLLPIPITWSGRGYVNSYQIQVSLDSNFADFIVNDSLLTESKYGFVGALADTQYFWRVNSSNDIGKTDWSNIQTFYTAQPGIDIVKPNGGERWHIGLEYYIEWQDNILENVYIDLIQDSTTIQRILTSPSNGAYLWQVPLTLEPNDNYKIRISSMSDSTLFGLSNQTFSIIDTVTSVDDFTKIPTDYKLAQNYPNPFNPTTTIQYSLPEAGHVNLRIYNLLGKEIISLVNEFKEAGNYAVKFEASSMPSGVFFYKFEANGRSFIKKMLLIK
ncbi:MAG: aryl-sulfate sulfotransferase [Melioribacteraceae bacterium]|nr:aryl-sulfate sulfotransferase [Melioribacteraceae bacterium]